MSKPKPAVAPSPPAPQLTPRDEAVLWAAMIEDVSPVVQRVLLTLAKEVRSRGQGGWIAFPSLNFLVKNSGVGRGSVVRSITELMERKLVTRVGGNVQGDTTVYTLKATSVQPGPRTTVDLGPPRTQVQPGPRTTVVHKSREDSPSTNTPKPKHGSLRKQGSSPPLNANPEDSRSLVKAGEREKTPNERLTPEMLKKIWAGIQQNLREQARADRAFAKHVDWMRLSGVDYKQLTVECPQEAIERYGEIELRLRIISAATEAGHLRGRDVRVVPRDPGRNLWPAEQPALREFTTRLCIVCEPQHEWQSLEPYFDTEVQWGRCPEPARKLEAEIEKGRQSLERSKERAAAARASPG